MNKIMKNIPLLIGFFVMALAIPISLNVATQKESVNPPLKAANVNPLIYLFPEKITSIKIGQTGSISVNLDTKGKVFNGIDVILKYDPVAIKIDKLLTTPGTIFKEYIGNVIVNEELGTIQISARGEYQGAGLLAKIGFISLQKGVTNFEKNTIITGSIPCDFKGSEINIVE